MIRRRSRPGVTLVELLVVLGIVGVLSAVLLPAVQSARESARRVACANNLRQLVVAVHHYESTFAAFPPTFCTTPERNAAGTGASWSIHARLLPHLEQAAAYDRIELDRDWHEQVASGVPFRPPEAYVCPSEPRADYRTKDDQPYVAPHTYGFNLGTWLVYDPSSQAVGDGAFVVNRGTTAADFLDGLSQTLAIAEVKAYQPYLRNTEDLGAAPPAEPGGFAGLHGQWKETGHTVWPDGRVHHSGVTCVFTPNTLVAFPRGGAIYDIDVTSQQEGKSATRVTSAAITARSYHPGLVQIALMDGSVQALADSVERGVWRGLGSR